MRPALTAVLVVLALAGCGQADDRAAVRATTQRFVAAFDARDAPTACAALSAATRSELERQEERSCPQVVTSLALEGGRVTRVEVDVTAAKVDLSSGESAFLSETPAGWRLSAVGCRPAGGDPRSQPMDCELSA